MRAQSATATTLPESSGTESSEDGAGNSAGLSHHQSLRPAEAANIQLNVHQLPLPVDLKRAADGSVDLDVVLGAMTWLASMCNGPSLDS